MDNNLFKDAMSLNFQNRTSKVTESALSKVMAGARTAKEISVSQTHTDENWVHTQKNEIKKVAAVASLAIPMLHIEKAVTHENLQYCNLSNEHLKNANINLEDYNLTSQAGVNKCIQDIALFDNKNVESLKQNNSFVQNYFSSQKDNKVTDEMVSELNQFMNNNSVFIKKTADGKGILNPEFTSIINKYDALKQMKASDIESGVKAITNMQNSSKALSSITSGQVPGQGLVNGYVGGLKSYGRRIVAQSLMDDNMKQGYNVSSAIIRPGITGAKIMAHSSTKAFYQGSKAYAKTLHRKAELFTEQAEKYKYIDPARYNDLLNKAKNFKSKGETVEKTSKAFYETTEKLRHPLRKSAKDFKTDAVLQKKNKQIIEKLQRDPLGKKTVISGKKGATAAKKTAKATANAKKGSKAVLGAKKTAKDAKKLLKMQKKADRARRNAQRLARLADLLAKGGKVGALAAKGATLASSVVGAGGVAAGGVAAGGVAGAGGAATVGVAATPVGWIIAIIAAVLFLLIVVIVAAVVIIVLLCYYAIHFASTGTNLQGNLDNLNYCQAIANAVTYDIGAEYTYIMDTNTERQFLNTVVVGKYGLPCTPQETSTYDKSYVWEESDNVSTWGNGEKVFKDTYVSAIKERNSVEPNANIIPIMNMMHTKMLNEIGFEEWPSALAYCYYMYAASHSVNKYDTNGVDPVKYIMIKDAEGNPSGYKLKKYGAGNGVESAIFYCNNGHRAPHVDYLQEQDDGSLIPGYIGKNGGSSVQFNAECNNIYFHDEYNNVFSSPDVIDLVTKLKKYLGYNGNATNYSYVSFYLNVIVPNKNGQFKEVYQALGGNKMENKITPLADKLNPHPNAENIHIFNLDANNANSLNIEVITENNYGKGNNIAVSCIKGNMDYSWYANAQKHCDDYVEVPWYSHDYPYGDIHFVETVDYVEVWQYEWLEKTVPGPGGFPMTIRYLNSYSSVEEQHNFVPVNNEAAGYVGMCNGHCAGHIVPTCDIITMMTYEGLAQLDNFKTPHYLTFQDVVGEHMYEQLKLEQLNAVNQYMDSQNMSIVQKLVGDSIVMNGSSDDYMTAAFLLSINKPFINDSNYKDVLAARYGKLENDIVTQATWRLYWMTLAKRWFSVFPQSPGSFSQYISKRALYFAAGIVDDTTSAIFPALLKMCSTLGIDDAQAVLDAANDMEDISTEEDMYSFEGWFLKGDNVYEYDDGAMEVLKSFYGDYYEDGYKMSFEAWDSFDVKFDEQALDIMPPQRIPRGDGHTTSNPAYTEYLNNGKTMYVYD